MEFSKKCPVCKGRMAENNEFCKSECWEEDQKEKKELSEKPENAD